MSKLPSMQFYPGDWMKDPALRAVSISARGLWIDMLCLMWESARRGYLVHATGHAVTPEQLARMTGCHADDVASMLSELENCGVVSRTGDGILYSRRMDRDERKRAACAEAGKRGGNPTLKGQPKGDAKGSPKGDANRKPTPSVSSSSSELQRERETREADRFGANEQTQHSHASEREQAAGYAGTTEAVNDSPRAQDCAESGCRIEIPAAVEQAVFETFGGPQVTWIREWLAAHPPGWIIEALKRTQAAKSRKPQYASAILAGWKRDGYPENDHGRTGATASNHRGTPTRGRIATADESAHADGEQF